VWKYLKAALLVSLPVPGLGRLPINVLAATGFGILGLGEPAFWLLGLGIETTVVFSLAFNHRFQKYVDGRELQVSEQDVETQRRALINLLDSDAKRKLSTLIDRCNQVLQVYSGTQADEYIVSANQNAFSKLQWLYLKLLVAQHYLAAAGKNDGDTLRQKISQLEADLKDPDASESLLQSKRATAGILKQRLNNFQNRNRIMEEIDSDLTRIEAQVDLALENATIQGKPQTISTEIELASDLVSGTLFGESEGAIAALDHTYEHAGSAGRREVN